MRILAQGQVSVWLDRIAASLAAKSPFPRSMPYAEVRVAQSGFPEGDPLEDIDPVDIRIDAEEGASLARLNEHILRMRNLKPSDVLVNPSGRPRAVGQAAKNRANRRIHDLTSGLRDAIPLQGMFNALADNGMIPVDEDGTQWSGMLLGGRECGDPEAASQRADIALAAVLPDYSVAPANVMLHVLWCKIGNRYEVTAYVG
jgi:hypothetical protein